VFRYSLRMPPRRWSAYVETSDAALLDAAHQRLGGPLVLVWDNLTAHHDAAMHELIAARPWLTVFRLPTKVAFTIQRGESHLHGMAHQVGGCARIRRGIVSGFIRLRLGKVMRVVNRVETSVNSAVEIIPLELPRGQEPVAALCDQFVYGRLG
jgi:hypothetical protein